MEEMKMMAKGSFWIFSSQVLTKLISFIYTVLLARFVSQEEIGIFYLVLSILGVLFIFTDFGIAPALGRYIAYLYGKQEFRKLRNLVNIGYFVGGTLTFIFSIFVFVFSGFISQTVGQPVIKPVLEMMSIWLLLTEITHISGKIMLARKKTRESQGLEVVQNLVKLIVTLIAFYVVGFNAQAISIGFLISFLLVLPLGIYFVILEMKTWKNFGAQEVFCSNLELGKDVVNFGILLTFIGALSVIVQYTDKIMLGYLLDDSVALAQIGIYAIVVGFASLTLIFTSTITTIFFPTISELYGRGASKDIDHVTRTSIKWMIMATTPIVIVMTVFGGYLLKLVFGPGYEEGSVVLVLFVISFIVNALFGFGGQILVAMRKLDVQMITTGAAAVLNVILNFLLIPSWGINGAALASLVSVGAASLITFYYSKKIFGFGFPKTVYKPILAGLLTFILIFFIRNQVLFFINNSIPEIQIGQSHGQFADELVQKFVKLAILGSLFALTLISYFLLLIILRAFGKEEVDILELGFKKIKFQKVYRDKILSIFRGI